MSQVDDSSLKPAPVTSSIHNALHDPNGVAGLAATMKEKEKHVVRSFNPADGTDDILGKPPLQVLRNLYGNIKFGSIRFPGSSQPPAKYLRVPLKSEETLCETGTRALLALFTSTWNLSPPSAIISVMGRMGADGEPLFVDPKVAPKLRRALKGAAELSNAWVFTNGVRGSSGVVELVGRALERSSAPLIGFAPWSLVDEREEMQGGGQIHFYKTGKSINAPASYAASVGTNDEDESLTEAVLDPSHDFFILVDDGSATHSRHANDTTAAFRSALRIFISDNDVSNDGIKTPTLSLVFNGGPMVLRQLLTSLEDDRSPAIVFTETGGAAADIAAYMQCETDKERLDVLADLAKRHKDDASYVEAAKELFPKISEAGSELGPDGSTPLLVIVPDISEVDDLEHILYEAILNGCRTQREMTLLAVTWGDRDVLRTLLEKEAEWQGERQERRQAKGLAFESALLRKDVEMANCMMEYAAEAGDVLLSLLFDEKFIAYDPKTVCNWLWANSEPPDEFDASTETSVRVSVSKNRLEQRVSVRKMHREMAIKQPAHWVAILSELVDGYAYHLGVRRQLTRSGSELDIRPTFTDLFMWAVIIGEKDLARQLWHRSRMPLRATCMASQVCRRLAREPRNSPFVEDLEASADEFEQWALDLLDSMDEETAAPLLCLIRGATVASTPGGSSLMHRRLLWDSSVLDSAAEEDGKLSVACKRIVSHKHAISLCDAFFHGDYPGSKCRILVDSGWLAILLQFFCPFAPGTWCEVLPTTWPVSTNMPSKVDLSRSRSNTMANLPVVDESDEPEDWARALEAQVADTDLDGKEDEAPFIRDMIADFRTGRFLSFYLVPKVKFLSFQLFYMVYVLLIPIYFFTSDAEHHAVAATYGLPRPVWGIEPVFWIWSVTRAIAEAQEVQKLMPVAGGPVSGLFGRFLEGGRMYLLDAWNLMDMSTNILQVVVIGLRLGATDNIEAQVWARVLYAIINILQWMRWLQILRVFRSVGILSIIIGRMVVGDVLPFLVIFAVVCPAFGIALSMLQPATMYVAADAAAGTSPSWVRATFLSVGSPFWAPWWGLLDSLRGLDDTLIESQGIAVIEYVLPLTGYAFSIFTMVVVMNLLIAAMGNTYSEIDEVAQIEWQYERVQLIIEYKDEKVLPPPLNLVYLFYRGVVWLLRQCKLIAPEPSIDVVTNGFKLRVSQAEELNLQTHEKDAMKKCMAMQDEEIAKHKFAQRAVDLVQEHQESTENGFEDITGRLDQIQMMLEELSKKGR